MMDRIYTRRELKIAVYEKDDAMPFVVVTNDKCTNHPIVLTGYDAEKLILAITDCLDMGDGEEGS